MESSNLIVRLAFKVTTENQTFAIENAMKEHAPIFGRGLQ